MTQTALLLVCATPNKRPRTATEAMMRAVALRVADDMIATGAFEKKDREGIADDIVKVTSRWCERDGYALARELENRCGWSPDTQMVTDLDGYWMGCDDEVRAAEKSWALENPMEPPLPIGADVDVKGQRGEIKEVSKYTPSAYHVQLPDERGLRIVCFEDVKIWEGR